MSEPVQKQTRRLRELDALRGIAALGVVLWHYKSHFQAAPLSAWLEPFYGAGYYAVDFFFVLSGLVLTRAYATEARRTRIAENIVKRIARMYPLHLTTLLFVAFAQWGLSEGLDRRTFVVPYNDVYHFLLNLGLLQYVGVQGGFSFNAPAWSISTELWVNVLFFSVLFGTRRLLPVALALVVVSFAIVVTTGSGSLAMVNTARYPAIPLVRTIYGFFMGVLLYELAFRRPWKWKPAPVVFDVAFVATALALLAGAVGKLSFHPHVEMFAVLLGFPGLILCAANGRGVKRALGISPLVYLGDISYSVYLIHFPLQLLLHVLAVLGWVQLDYANPVSLGIFLLLTLSLASLSYQFLEVPAQQVINRRWNDRNHGRER